MGNSFTRDGKDFVLNEGDRWFIERGTGNQLPVPTTQYYWQLNEVTENGDYFVFRKVAGPEYVTTTENLEQIIKDREEQIKALTSENYKMHREFDEVRQAGLDQNKKLQKQADDFRELYHEQVRARDKAIQEKDSIIKSFDERGREIEDLKNQLDIWEKEEVETVKAAINPEWAEMDAIHKKRLAAETESIELDNKRKQAELTGYEDYPHSVYQRLHSKVEEVMSALSNRVAVIWVALVAFGVNEVIQWLTR